MRDLPGVLSMFEGLVDADKINADQCCVFVCVEDITCVCGIFVAAPAAQKGMCPAVEMLIRRITVTEVCPKGPIPNNLRLGIWAGFIVRTGFGGVYDYWVL